MPELYSEPWGYHRYHRIISPDGHTEYAGTSFACAWSAFKQAVMKKRQPGPIKWLTNSIGVDTHGIWILSNLDANFHARKKAHG